MTGAMLVCVVRCVQCGGAGKTGRCESVPRLLYCRPATGPAPASGRAWEQIRREMIMMLTSSPVANQTGSLYRSLLAERTRGLASHKQNQSKSVLTDQPSHQQQSD